MSWHTLATHNVLPSHYQPTAPPALIPLAPIEYNTRAWPISMLWSFPLPASTPAASFMPAGLLGASLAATLSVFPVLCAALVQDVRGHATLRLDSSNPVRLVHAAHPAQLAACIPPALVRYAAPQPPTAWQHPQLLDGGRIPAGLCATLSGDWAGVGCAVQVTRFGCGGVVVGLAAFHCLMDAQAAATFVGEWGRQCAALKAADAAIPPMPNPPSFDRSFMTNGMEQALADHPVHDNIFLIRPTLPANTATAAPAQPYEPPHVVSRVYHFPRPELAAIRRAAMGAGGPEGDGDVSVHDALFAHMAQVIGAATGTVGDEPVLVCQATNGRKVFGQPHFFGSCAFWMHHRSTHAAVQASLPATAASIHHTHASRTRSSLLAYNAYIASAPTTAHTALQARITTHDYHVASWRNAGMYAVDFGWGGCDLMGPGQYGWGRYCIFGDGAGVEGAGGVDVWLALEDEQWKRMVEQGQLHRYAQTTREHAQE